MKTESDAEIESARTPFWAAPLLAVQFLTRIPVPGIATLSPSQVRAGLARSTGWFPVVGALVGLITATIISLFDLWWPHTVGVLIALIVEAGLTGAFHEDAVADTCDGLGGGRDPAHVREIMKDSRIGSYGALGLMFAVGMRAATLIALPVAVLFPAVIASAAFGRFLAVVIMRVVPPVQVQTGIGKDIGSLVRTGDLLLATVLVLPVYSWFIVVHPLPALGAVGAAAVFVIWFRQFLLRKLGGSTGDCLGFAAYAGQLIVLLAAIVS